MSLYVGAILDHWTEFLLLPESSAPKVLFFEVVLLVGGIWLSDYGFTTTKHSEPIAFVYWLIGSLFAIIAGIGLLFAPGNALSA